jgi:glycosyltransferase involved in cell wall biosynthesis
MQLTTDFRLGGAERVMVGLMRELRERGVECAAAGLFEGGQAIGRARRALQSEGFPVHCAALEPKWRLWRLAGLRRFVQNWEPDVLHCHLFHGNATGALLRLAGLRGQMLWTHHNVEARPVPLRRAFYRLAWGMPDCHVFVSGAARRHHLALAGPGRRSEVIHDGIDLRPFLAVRPEPGTVFGALGRISPGKGMDMLVRAFARVRGGCPEARLRIGGRGPDDWLREIIGSEGVEEAVKLEGFITDVPRFLSEINVFVNPSLSEGFGLTLLEALAAGLPCVASRVGALPEVGGEFVRWAEPGDVGSLSEQMAAALSEPGGAEKVAGRRRRARRFSRDRMADDYLRLYGSLL